MLGAFSNGDDVRTLDRDERRSLLPVLPRRLRTMRAWAGWRHPVAERCHTAVKTVRKVGEQFEVVAADEHTYRGRTVVYAAGSQYRQLGVPSEDRFIGAGLRFARPVTRRCIVTNG